MKERTMKTKILSGILAIAMVWGLLYNNYGISRVAADGKTSGALEELTPVSLSAQVIVTKTVTTSTQTSSQQLVIDGVPQYEKKTVEETVVVMDDQGNPVQATNEDGSPKTDDEGNPLYQTKTESKEVDDLTQPIYGTEEVQTTAYAAVPKVLKGGQEVEGLSCETVEEGKQYKLSYDGIDFGSFTFSDSDFGPAEATEDEKVTRATATSEVREVAIEGEDISEVGLYANGEDSKDVPVWTGTYGKLDFRTSDSQKVTVQNGNVSSCGLATGSLEDVKVQACIQGSSGTCYALKEYKVKLTAPRVDSISLTGVETTTEGKKAIQEEAGNWYTNDPNPTLVLSYTGEGLSKAMFAGEGIDGDHIAITKEEGKGTVRVPYQAISENKEYTLSYSKDFDPEETKIASFILDTQGPVISSIQWKEEGRGPGKKVTVTAQVTDKGLGVDPDSVLASFQNVSEETSSQKMTYDEAAAAYRRTVSGRKYSGREILVTAQDFLGNQTTVSSEDATQPEVELSLAEDGKEGEYYTKDLSVTVTAAFGNYPFRDLKVEVSAGKEKKTYSIPQKDLVYDATSAAYQASITLSDQDLEQGEKGIGNLTDRITEIKAVLQVGNQEVTDEVSPNVIIDTKAPEISLNTSGELYEKEMGQDQDNKIFVKGEEQGKDYTQTITLTVTDVNFDADAYLQKLKDLKDSDALKGKLLEVSLKTDQNNYSYELQFAGQIHQVTAIEATLPAIADQAGNVLADSAELKLKGKVSGQDTAYSVGSITGGQPVMTFYLDAQAPYGTEDLPEFTVETTGLSYETEENGNKVKTFYNNSTEDPGVIQVKIPLTDGEGVGIEKVEYWLKGAQGAIAAPAGGTLPSEEATKELDYDRTTQSCSFSLNLQKDAEVKNIELWVKATDRAGNSRSVFVTFHVDTKAPEIQLQTLDSPVNSDGTYSYYDKDLTYTFAIRDQDIDSLEGTYTYSQRNTKTGVYEKTGETAPMTVSVEEDKTRAAASFTLEDGQILVSYQLTAYDKAGQEIGTSQGTNVHRSILAEEGIQAVVDETDPVFTIRQSNKTADGSNGRVDYYQKEVTFEVTISDINLQNASLVTNLLESGLEFTTQDGVTYTGSFTLDDRTVEPLTEGDLLSELKAVVQDKALRTVTKETLTDDTTLALQINGKEITKSENSQNIVIDKADPEIIITAPEAKTSSNSQGTVYYYNQDQQIQVVVNDIHLKDKRVTYKLQGEDKTLSLRESAATPGRYEASLDLPDGTMVSDLAVTAEDYGARTSQDDSCREKVYIIDTSKPTLAVSLTGNGIASYFTNNGSVYIRFADPATGESGQWSQASRKNVTLTVTTADKNLETEAKARAARKNYANSYFVGNNLSDGIAWEGTLGVNVDSTLTYTKSISVPADSTGTIRIDLNIQDLAGNQAEAFVDQMATGAFALNAATGRLTGRITADQSRPSSTNDERQAPVITLEPNQGAAGDVTNSSGRGVKLYGGSMSYSMHIYDPIYRDGDTQLYSGLASVKWTVESDQAGLISTSGNNNAFDGQQSVSLQVPVSINGIGETNNITVTVTAVDKAGNETTYKEYLAIDNQAPRVTISYDNNSVLNGKYFKADRNLTIQVEDLNFDSSRTSVNTQMGMSGWSQRGNVYTALISYNSDGDYTFEMATADKANNQAAIDYTNGGANAVPQAFTVDKTAPVISVSFDNNDVKNGKYYKANRIATVSVQEHNFNAGEVGTVVTASLDGQGIAVPSLGSFSDSGDSHRASIPFQADGDYTITVNYTDLAGNPAQTVTVSEFTIDKTLPTAEITNVQNGSAYTGTITPTITLQDVNFDPNGYSIQWKVTKLKGTSSLTAADHGVVASLPHGVTFSISNLEELAENDGIYLLSATVTDLAGNTFTTEDLVYSVNRFGSVYTAYDEATRLLLETGYTNGAQVLKFLETNPNKLTSHSITISINGSTKTLKEGRDYEVKLLSSGGWQQYLYTILEAAFLDDKGEPIQGKYEITILSEDEAGNENSNRTNVQGNAMAVSYTIDKEGATGYIDVSGLKEGKDSITAAQTEITVHWEDNNGMSKVEIYVNGKLFKTLEGEELAAANGSYTFTLEESQDVQSIYAVLTDVAGNETRLEEVSFYLNSSTFQQFLHNKPLFYGSLAALLAAAALIIILIIKKRKKDQEKAA